MFFTCHAENQRICHQLEDKSLVSWSTKKISSNRPPWGYDIFIYFLKPTGSTCLSPSIAMIAVEIYLRSICFARMVWKIWHAHHVNQPIDGFSMIFPVNHPFWSILGIPMTMETPILAAAIAVHSYAETCRSHWVSDLYIYISYYIH